MKLVLLQSPVQDFYDTTVRLQPLGLACLKAAVKKHLPQIDVVIRDFHQGWGRRTIPIPRALSYLKKFYRYPDQSPFSTFHQYYHFGASFETIADTVAAESPDLVGISSLFTPYCREVVQCAEAIRKRTAAPILVGGSHASAMAEHMLQHHAIDYVIRGEGERALVEFLQAYARGTPLAQVPNLAYKQAETIMLNPLAEPYSLEELPIPDLSDFSPETYTYEGRPLCTILTSRGCPFQCSFCSVHTTFGYHYRRRSTASITDEITHRYGQGYRVFDFEDDNLAGDREALILLCRQIIRRFPARSIELLAMNGILYHHLDAELMTLMKQAGFKHLNLSLVSTDPEVHHSCRRPFDLERYRNVVQEAHALGFDIVSYQILGLPQESISSMIQTLVFHSRLPVLIGASPFYLCPRTAAAEAFPDPSEQDMIRARLCGLGVNQPNAPRNAVYTLFVTSRIINFIKAVSVHGQELPIFDALEACRQHSRRFALGAEILARLLAEGKLHAATKEGLKPLPAFDASLFSELWQHLEYIITQQGKTVTV
ncbi:MAG TPA: cobalamin-dependent protein [Thermodesulfobacteriota bacterium]|nr:cobalamin-dependent protein [Deltaproteobacteria bacterium]HNU70092.1 cobalamin-dependent protein [Thermodesulfobacteriota bacterium]HOC38184.1 cobalamin-dependent protein [Thermodesulfobacteriota bacterium]